VKVTEINALRVAEAVNNREVSASSLIEEVIEHCKGLDNKVFSCLATEMALEQAAAVDRKIKSGFNLPLAGVPLVIADDFSFRGMPLALASSALQNYHPPLNAASVEKIVGAGAVVVGKTAVGDMGLDTVAGKSEGGTFFKELLYKVRSGAAIAASCGCILSLENDSSGMTRQSASRCGIFSLRPTPGRVSRYGLNLRSGSFDYPGFVATHLDDLAVLLQASTGYDERDIMTAVNSIQRDKYIHNSNPKEITIGFCSSLTGFLDEEPAAAYEKMYLHCRENGFKTVDLTLDILPEALRAFYVVAFAETSSTLSRFDGIRFGMAVDSDDLEEYYFKTRRLTFGDEACRRSIFGTYLLSENSYERYYKKAINILNRTRQVFAEVLDQCDLLLFPLFKSVSPPDHLNFIQSYEEDIFTAPVNMAGLPSLAFPGGVQLITEPFGEEKLLALGEYFKTAAEETTRESKEGEV